MSDITPVAPTRAGHQPALYDAALLAAVHVARDWAIEQHGDRYNTRYAVIAYMHRWFKRNGAVNHPEDINDLVDAVWALAELPNADSLQLVEDTWKGTSDEARDMLRNQYERDLSDALNRITWKA